MRDCNNCIHHTSGMCSSWECEFESIEMHDAKVREKVVRDFAKYLIDKMGSAQSDIVDFALDYIVKGAEE